MAYSKPKTPAKKSSLAILLFCAILCVWYKNAMAASVLDENSKAEEYKLQCKAVKYKDVARTPERYEEQDIILLLKSINLRSTTL